MGLLTGKKGLILGLVNDYSIAWGITQKLHEEGAELGFTFLPDKDLLQFVCASRHIAVSAYLLRQRQRAYWKK